MNMTSSQSEATPPICEKTTECIHCGLPIPEVRLVEQDLEFKDSAGHFCCGGCEAVYKIINENGLTQFYELKDLADQNLLSPPNPGSSKFLHFDDPSFKDHYLESLESNTGRIKFYLEGVHCAACVWLIEKLPSVRSGVLDCKLDFGRSIVTIIFKCEEIEISDIATTLDSLGYKPHPIVSGEEAKIREAEKKRFLIRIGIAGACAGNTMMIAVSLYQGLFTGIEDKYGFFLQWMSFILSLPAIFYSATPFYKAAWGGLKAKLFHIDLPISLGIIVGFLASTVNTVRGAPHIYYDSICMLIFLLLIGRWAQRKGVEKALNQSDLLFALTPNMARRVVNGKLEEIFVMSLNIGDIVEVQPNEQIPVDGVLVFGNSTVDLSVLTGESKPIPVSKGIQVYAGSTNLGGMIRLEVVSDFTNSRVGKLMRMVEESASRRASITATTDKISGYFVFAVLLVATTNFLIWFYNSGFYEAFDSTLALLVISCPCALGLAAPLTLSAAVARAAKNGILISGADSVERLSKINNIFFDKTGTLTEGVFAVREIFLFERNDSFRSLSTEEIREEAAELGSKLSQALSIIFYAEKDTSHPAGQALLTWLRLVVPTDFEDFDTTQWKREARLGKGVLVRGGNDEWRVGSWSFTFNGVGELSKYHQEIYTKLVANGLTPIVITHNKQPVLIFGLGDKLRVQANEVIGYFKNNNVQPGIISGDVPEIVTALATQLHVEHENTHSLCSPEDKAEIVTEKQGLATAMVGDGANDAAALKGAFLGIGIQGGAEICLRVADVYLTTPELRKIKIAFSGAHRAIRVIHRNLAFSLIYNVTGATLAVLGLANPLIAAVLMPLSSLTVVVSSLFSRTFSEKD